MTPQTQTQLAVPVNAQDHSRGPKNAPITLVEYGDFECPHCGQAHYQLQELEKAIGESMRLVFREFPLTTVHPHAAQAAEAAESAGAQRKFWPMHDILFENQDALEEEDLLRYATAIDLDVEQFARDLSEERFAPRVREHFMGGVHSGVNGTPTFFINGVRHDGGFDYQSLLEAINEQL
jgi:protein-disulfide isomerase